MTEFRNRLLDIIVSECNSRLQVSHDPWFIDSKNAVRKTTPEPNFKDRLILSKIGKYYTSKNTLAKIITRIWENPEDISHYEILYDLLENQQSKDTLVEITALKLLGQQHIRLSIENEKYAELHGKVEECLIENQSKEIPNFNDWKLNLYDLSKIGYPIKINYIQMGIATTFGVEQYAYPAEDILVNDNDVVLDCGGCWGDTALYFCAKAKNVRVFSFEFIPSNITLLEENLELNANCDVTIIPNPVWNDSTTSFYIKDRGPASAVSFEPTTEVDTPVKGVSIDDFVNENGLEKVNFIKMDIEGAEPFALKGAVNTLKQFKPKLAIAIYHCPEDFSRIALFIKELDLGYKFYLGHFTPHGAETILFSKAD